MGKINPKAEFNRNEDDELVLTPGGLRPKSKVHFVRPGHHISEEKGRLKIMDSETGEIIKDLGEINRVTEKKAANFISRVKLAEKKKGTMAPGPITDGWIINSEWTNNTGNPISYFKTRWIVPPEPATDNGQTVFLFNGIQQTRTLVRSFFNPSCSGAVLLQAAEITGRSPTGMLTAKVVQLFMVL